MNRMHAISWVLTVTLGLRLSQRKTLAELVGAALTVERVSLPEIGRRLLSTTAKHGTKRVWRFTKNQRVEVSDAMEGVVRRLLKSRKKKPVLVALDWTEVRKFHTLVAAVVIGGRAVPLLWASYEEWEFHRSQNSLEEGLLRLLKTMLPEGVRVILLADRGFGRTELARTCQSLGFSYVIRIAPDVWVEADGYRGNLRDYPVKKGVCRLLKHVDYRKKDPVRQHVVVHWRKGLPKERDECWFLMTNLEASAQRLCLLYGKRMPIEEFFRDGKSRRNGLALRNTQITKPDRFDRLLLILVLAYLLLCGLGLRAKQLYCPSNWCTNQRPNECSVFTIGRRMLDKIEVLPASALAALAQALARAAPNWG